MIEDLAGRAPLDDPGPPPEPNISGEGSSSRPIVLDEGDTAGEKDAQEGPDGGGSLMEGDEKETVEETADGSEPKGADSSRNVTNAESVSKRKPVEPNQLEKPVLPNQKSAELVQSEPEEGAIIPLKPVLLVSQSQVRYKNLTFKQKKHGEGSEAAASLMQSVAPADVQVPHSLAEALHIALKEASTKRPRAQAWIDLVRDLFAAIYVRVRGPAARLSEAAKRFPTLKDSEAERLIDYFEIVVVDGGKDWMEWRQQVVGAAVQAQKSSLSFEGIIWKSIGQERVKKAGFQPAPLQGWVNKVVGRTQETSDDKLIKKTFLFKTTMYKPEEIVRLRGVCEKDYGKYAPMMIREGTDDEWRILQGLVEGTIVAKQMPQFVKRIMKIDEQVRLVQTIRAQVEGCLVMDLSGESPIKEAFMSTKCLQESIATAAVTRGTGGMEVWKMVAQVKSISYDGAEHALYFHFFTREIAAKFAGMKVPFHRFEHTLRNIHQEHGKTKKTAWEAQVDSNGERYDYTGFYSCVLKNVSRSVDLLKFSGYLRKILGVDFQLDDLDKGGPYSDTSTLWELTVESDACPSVLRGINRIYWGHTMLVVEHPAMRGKRQCLRCGEAGHPMRKCAAPLEDLLKTNCLQVSVDDFKKLTPTVSTFRSMEELRDQVEAVRLRQDEEKQQERKQEDETEEEKKEKVQRTNKILKEESAPSKEIRTASKEQNTGVNPNKSSPASSEWVTVKPKKKRRESHQQQSEDERVQTSRREAYKSSLKANLEQMKLQENTKGQVGGVQTVTLKAKIEVEDNVTQQVAEGAQTEGSSSSDEPRKKKKPRHKKKMNILKKKASTLLMMEGQVKNSLVNMLTQVEEESGRITAATPKEVTEGGVPELKTIQDVLHWLNFRSIPTPATGNCQIYAVCQGLTCSDQLLENKGLLAEMAKLLKHGCLVRALLDFDIKFPPGVRKETLKELQRGTDSTSPKETKRLFQEYLLEFADSSSQLEVNIAPDTWGSNDTLLTMSTVLQRDIYVISHPPGFKVPGVQFYTPETRTAQGKSYQTSGEYSMSIVDFYTKMAVFLREITTKQHEKWPIILRYGGQHYSAILLGTREWEAEDVKMSDSSDEDDYEDIKVDEVHKEVNEDTEPSISSELTTRSEDSLSNYGRQSPWVPEEWKGNFEELISRLEGPTIHHGLKCEITDIIMTKDPRMCELLHFLADTVSKLSLPEQEELMKVNIADPQIQRYFMQKYQISAPILQQWYEKVWLENQPEEECLLLSDGSPSGSEYKDSERSQSSQDTSSSEPTETQVAKRICRRDGEESKGEPMEIDPVARELMDDFENSTGDHDNEGMTLDNFKLAWHELLPHWEEQTGIPFPLVSSTKTLWVKAAHHESNRLLHLIKDVPGSHFILDSVHPSVLVEMTKPWREQCWLDVIEAGKREGLADISGQWFEQWEHRFMVMIGTSQRMAIINSSQEWTRLRKLQYGGNAVLRLLAPRQVVQLAGMLICSHIFAEQIAALVGDDYHPNDSIMCLLQRHLKVVDTRQDYAERIQLIGKGAPEAWRELFEFCHAPTLLQISKNQELLLQDQGSPSHY